jgi:peptidoglycan-associated lipoprotein
MRCRILLVLLVGLGLAACETTPSDTGAASGIGAAGSGAAPGGSSVATDQLASTPPPTGPRPGSQEDLVTNVGDRVFFDFDSIQLRADARATLEKQAEWLRQNRGVAVTVEGHADERGTREYNLALGERRAVAMRDYLVALGIEQGRIKTISYGKERPVEPSSSDAAWQKNRRGVLIVN